MGLAGATVARCGRRDFRRRRCVLVLDCSLAGVHLAADRRLLSEAMRVLALVALGQSRYALALPLLACAFALVGEPLPLVGNGFALLGDAVTFVGDAVAMIGSDFSGSGAAVTLVKAEALLSQAFSLRRELRRLTRESFSLRRELRRLTRDFRGLTRDGSAFGVAAIVVHASHPLVIGGGRLMRRYCVLVLAMLAGHLARKRSSHFALVGGVVLLVSALARRLDSLPQQKFCGSPLRPTA
jgi:hypothetical protein